MRVQEQEPGRRKDQLICYECKKSGHLRTECPQLKKRSFGKKKKLKAHVATWSDEESSDEDEEEVANLCLMALDDEPKVRTRNWKLREGENRHSGLLEGISFRHVAAHISATLVLSIDTLSGVSIPASKGIDTPLLFHLVSVPREGYRYPSPLWDLSIDTGFRVPIPAA
ncbi:hypothetical protein GQ457_09G021480 [Hibiscus cannabinus]